MIARVLAVLLLAGFVLHYVWWIAGIVATIVLYRLAQQALHAHRAEAAAAAKRRAELAARADQQHRWTIVDDARGTYGRYPPAQIP